MLTDEGFAQSFHMGFCRNPSNGEERADSFQHIFKHDRKLRKAILRTAKNLIGFCWLKQANIQTKASEGKNKIFAKDTKER